MRRCARSDTGRSRRTISPGRLLNLSGLVAELRRTLEDESTPAAVCQGAATELRRLVEAGLLSEVKPPITDLSAYRDRKAVPIQGEPLSETVIRERR